MGRREERGESGEQGAGSGLEIAGCRSLFLNTVGRWMLDVQRWAFNSSIIQMSLSCRPIVK